MTWVKKGIVFNKEFAQLPVVDDLGTSYQIYYSTRDEQGRSIPKWFLVAKNDLTIQSPPHSQILPLGKPGSFDSHGVMPSSIITLEDGTKYMYYVGWSKRIDVPYWNSTGLAISKDNGITWEKYSEGPVFIGDNGNWVGTVEIRKTKFWYQMSYSSCHWEDINGKLEPIYDIKSARSKNGIEWTPTKTIKLTLDNDEGGIASFRITNNEVYYSKRNNSDYRTNPENSYKIYSRETKSNSDETLELSPSEDEIMCAYPFIVEEEDKYIMFYNSDFGKSGISYAIKMK